MKFEPTPTREELARAYRRMSAYERGQAVWRGDPRAQAHVAEVADRIEDELRTGTGRFAPSEVE